METASVGKIFVAMGLVVVLIGFFLMFGGKFIAFGRLPGDIRVEKENVSFYFPLASCLLASVFFSLVLWIFSKFK
jgi:NAD/NADP transhydrogenase beta subunit